MIHANEHDAHSADTVELLQAAMAALGRGDTRAAIDRVIGAIGAITEGDAACVAIRSGSGHVLVSTWGECPLPRGLRAPDLLAQLEGGFLESCTWPLLTPDGAVGWLWVGRRNGRRFLARELELVHALADLMALRLGRARRQASTDESQPSASRLAPAVRLVVSPPPPPPPRTDGRQHLVVPAFPPALARIVAATDDETGDLATLADAVTLDPLLPPRVLRAADAPALGRVRRPGSMTEALATLGLRGVRNLAIGQFARSLFARWEPIDQMLWEQALGTAVGTQLLLERAGHGGAEDGYLCGLLHNMATVALQSAEPGAYRDIVRAAVAGATDWDDAERAAFGRPALDRLPELLDEWQLPPAVDHALRASARHEVHGSLGSALAWARWAGLRASGEWERLLAGRPEPPWLSDAIDAAGRRVPAATRAAVAAQIGERCRTLRRLMD